MIATKATKIENEPPRFSRAELKGELAAFATKLGFDSCRVAACAPPLHANEFGDWLQDGAHGEMGYMQRGEEKRSDPQKVLPGARSIIVLALNYFQGAMEAARPRAAEARPARGRADSRGRIARYAWGDDYHEVIARKLDKINNFLREFGGEQKCYVDTGPVLERDHAAQAGSGWHGKSTMLIDERLGTWFFLAEILTTLELPPDGPARDRCGTCKRCITACPTGAITAPHRLDARRCISYLTIELKGSIPLEFRPLIGDRIFGCDDCLDACPWNRFAQVSRESAFSARRSTVGFALRDYLKLSDAEFRNLFRNSPIKRIKRRGFLRNVCVALGNIGTRDDLPALQRAASDSEPLIAEHAVWAIGRIQERCRAGKAENN
ncbi:MAG TPA: tRNA epoxyqueuosine(34) reductase QueG [Chthoniobacterales bacterium]|nr:tRNA epoxyqueuosine(34) reductase QueG [Chthoniobacterales bacterium]